MKNVIVTGATGFIGARATTFLRGRGYEVHALGRTAPRDADVHFHAVDLLGRDDLDPLLARLRASHLLHLAWNVAPGQYWRAADNLDWVASSLRLLRGFAAHGGERAVFAGTCAEYQWGAPRFVEGQTPCAPATLYGAAKDSLRRLAEAFGAVAPLSIGWGRIFFLYGPGEKPGRLIGDAIDALLRGAPFPTSHGRQRRDFLHVEDVAGAFAALVDSGLEGAVNIGSGAAPTIREILEMIARETGHGECLRFGERALPAGEPDVIEAEVTRLNEELRFRPRYDLASGLAEAIARRRQAGF